MAVLSSEQIQQALDDHFLWKQLEGGFRDE
jgi:hypothetical protein